jgi:outer membrane protein assembly factor BamD
MIALLSLSIFAASCSSLSMPSVPWFSSPAKADPTAETLYEEGMRAFNDKKYVRAIDNFSKIKTDYPFSPMVTQAELMAADAYYLNQQYPEAINALKEYQSMHPTSEQIPFVILRLGQAHFDQFTTVDRDQKNTEIAKGYFETLITNHPKSPQAAIARENLAKAVEYLAEHEFSAAQFYFQQQKYPAARDRFEEIVRKYKDTPTAVKSLFFLGESYRIEKNGPRATLAYEALIQRYPKSPYASEARTQLALVEKEKLDPLDLLLMRDRRPTGGAAPEVKEDPALAKLKDLNLVAKKEVVHEEPGDEKGFLSRVADKINPFSSSGSSKKEENKSESALDMVARKNQTQKQESGGILSSLWPFGSKESKEAPKIADGKSSSLVAGVDESLKQKGIDAQARQAALKPPPANLPKVEPTALPATDTVALLGSIDANLQKRGTNANELPPPPQASEGFSNAVATQALATNATAAKQSPQNVQASGILSSIDQKLKAQGVEPSKFEKPPTPEEVKQSAAKAQPKSVELEPKLALEKGPLFLNPGEVQTQQPTAPRPEADKQGGPQQNTETVVDTVSRPLVKGPVQPQQVASRPSETTKPAPGQEDQPKGVFEQIRQDLENASKALNPFRW